MDILIIMCLGILVGNRIFPKEKKKLNEYLQLSCTLLLIFSMGVMLGQRDSFFEDLASLGITREASIVLLGKSGASALCEVRGTRLAISKEVARAIAVTC